MQYIIFTPNAAPISDYDVEDTYQKLKTKRRVKISSSLLFTRFRVGVKVGDIPPFTIILIDINKDVYKEVVKADGNFPFRPEPKVLDLEISYLMILL